MKKKTATKVEVDNDEEEFDIDEPEELQENSDDDWSPVSCICDLKCF